MLDTKIGANFTNIPKIIRNVSGQFKNMKYASKNT